ncbi:hypothetical protein TcasGA2_TC001345 [Tribolium castaneum]|uniref:Uncharacterized protein n=1 Tax=Tribolium castaneum TaxID=7070 RepID=D6WC95_TRICA|nr:hypothetical protein TcasGA2_TC001345 [Tribolium castaneum]
MINKGESEFAVQLDISIGEVAVIATAGTYLYLPSAGSFIWPISGTDVYFDRVCLNMYVFAFQIHHDFVSDLIKRYSASNNYYVFAKLINRITDWK